MLTLAGSSSIVLNCNYKDSVTARVFRGIVTLETNAPAELPGFSEHQRPAFKAQRGCHIEPH